MHGKTLAFSLMVIISLLAPLPGAAQECKFIPDDEGGERHIIIDGETYFYLPLDKSRELQKKVEKYDLLQQENHSLQKRIEVQSKIIAIQMGSMDRLEEENEFTHEFIDRTLEPPEVNWYEEPEVNFLLGVAVTTGMFFLWSSASSK